MLLSNMSESAAFASLDGSVTWRGDRDYEPTRRSMLWNGWKPTRLPEVIVRAASEHDVVTAVTFARSRGMKVAVRASGHSWCGWPLRDGGLLLDLSRLRDLSIDPVSRTATFQPGATSRELASALAEHDLAFPVGHCGRVGLSGFLLSGGLGWNSGVWGPACESLTAIEAVTADGELMCADEDTDGDLFWAARGAGPGLCAAVTRFHVKVHPSPGAVTTGTYVYRLEDAGEVLRWAVEARAALPATVELTLLLAAASPDVGSGAGERVVLLTCTAFVYSPDEASRALAVAEACPCRDRCLSSHVRRAIPFEALYEGEDAAWPDGHRYAADNVWLNAGVEEAFAALCAQIARAPSPKSLVLLALGPPRPEDAALPDMAFSMPGSTYVGCYSIWEDERDDNANVGWPRAVTESVAPFPVGHYVGETDILADHSRAARSFSPAAWERLASVTGTLDPRGVFQSYFDGE
jgi:FAD/FMN-containing dehydrogenase